MVRYHNKPSLNCPQIMTLAICVEKKTINHLCVRKLLKDFNTIRMNINKQNPSRITHLIWWVFSIVWSKNTTCTTSDNAIYYVVDYQHSYVIGKQMPTLYMSRIKHVISKEHAISHEIKIHSWLLFLWCHIILIPHYWGTLLFKPP